MNVILNAVSSCADEGSLAIHSSSMLSTGNRIDDDQVVERCYSCCRANARAWVLRVLIILLDRPELRGAVLERQLCEKLASIVMEKKIASLTSNVGLNTWRKVHLGELRAVVEQKLTELQLGGNSGGSSGSSTLSKRVKT